MIVQEISTPDIKTFIGLAAAPKKQDPIVSRRAKIDSSDLKEEKVRARFRRLAAVEVFVTRLLLRTLLMVVCMNVMMFRSERVYFFVASIGVFAVCHVVHLSLDIINMKRYSLMSRSEKIARRYLIVRVCKNCLTIAATAVMAVQLESGGVGRWIVAFEIILVLYFVLIIYFIINTGEMVQYLNTISFNTLLFVQLFFVQNDLFKCSHPCVLRRLWIFSVYLAVSLLLVAATVYRFVSAKYEKVYGYLLAVGVVFTALLGVVIMHLRVETYLDYHKYLSMSVSLFGLLACVLSCYSKKYVARLIDQSLNSCLEQIRAPESAGPAVSVPYYLTRSSDNFYKPSDKYDLLKLYSQSSSLDGKEKETTRSDKGEKIQVYTSISLKNKFASSKAKREVVRQESVETNKVEFKEPCVVCCSDRQTCVYLPCGHGSLCSKCSVDIFRSDQLCHLCKSQVHSILTIESTVLENIYRVKQSMQAK